MRHILLLALLGPVLGLSACSQTITDPFLTASLKPNAPPVASEVAPEFAVAFLPPTGGQIRSVRQMSDDGGLRQEIIYANATSVPGENKLTVSFPPEGVGREKFLRAPTRRQIRAEIAADFPGQPLTIDNSIGDNLQGPYGFAHAALANGGSCLYAWQLAVPDTGESTFRKALRRPERAQVRLRFCHPSIPQERITALMQGLRVKPVNRELLAFLQFAGGSGTTASIQPSAVTAPAPVVAAAASVEAEPQALPARPRINRTVPLAEAPRTKIIRKPVAVPMPEGVPSEVQASAAPVAALAPAAPAAPARSTVIRHAAEVPMPDEVAARP